MRVNTKKIADWDDDRILYNFDEAVITRYADLEFYNSLSGEYVNVTIQAFFGDRTGLLHLQSRQRLYVEYPSVSLNETLAPCSFLVDANATFVAPPFTELWGTRSTFAGQIIGVDILGIQEGADVRFTWTAQTGRIAVDLTVNTLTTPGNMSVPFMVVKKGGRLTFVRNTGDVSRSELFVEYMGQTATFSLTRRT